MSRMCIIEELQSWHAKVYSEGKRIKAGKILRVIDKLTYVERHSGGRTPYVEKGDVLTKALLGGVTDLSKLIGR